MQFSWKNLSAAIAELVTSKQLSVESGKLITDAIESDVSATSTSANAVPATAPPAATIVATLPVATAPEAVAAPVVPVAPAPAPVAVAVPVAPAPVVAAAPVAPAPVTESAIQKQLADALAENTRLKAALTPGLAAAAAAGDLTQQSSQASAGNENPHFANLKRIKEKYNKFGLTAEIDLGSTDE